MIHECSGRGTMSDYVDSVDKTLLPREVETIYKLIDQLEKRVKDQEVIIDLLKDKQELYEQTETTKEDNITCTANIPRKLVSYENVSKPKVSSINPVVNIEPASNSTDKETDPQILGPV